MFAAACKLAFELFDRRNIGDRPDEPRDFAIGTAQHLLGNNRFKLLAIGVGQMRFSTFVTTIRTKQIAVAPFILFGDIGLLKFVIGLAHNIAAISSRQQFPRAIHRYKAARFVFAKDGAGIELDQVFGEFRLILQFACHAGRERFGLPSQARKQPDQTTQQHGTDQADKEDRARRIVSKRCFKCRHRMHTKAHRTLANINSGLAA